jgi:hypothetical protein
LGLRQVTGSTDFSTLDVTARGSGLAAVVVDGAAAAAATDPMSVMVLA